MDIRAGIITTTLLAALATFFLFRGGIRTFRSGRKLNYYSLRRQHMATFWRLMFAGVFMLVLTLWLGLYGERRSLRHELFVFVVVGRWNVGLCLSSIALGRLLP